MIIDITGTSKYVIEKVADMLAANFIDMGCDVYKVLINYGGEVRGAAEDGEEGGKRAVSSR